MACASITAAAVAGALTHVSGGAVNVVNATRLAQSRDIRVNQMQQESQVPYSEVVEVRVAERCRHGARHRRAAG